MAAVREAFKPEFLNRLDEVLVFHRLTRSDITKVSDLQVDRLRARLAERHIDLELTEAARDWLGDHGYDPAYGARPLRRLIQKAIGDELARRLLAGDVHDGDTVVVDADGNALRFSVKEPAPAA
jgi:ATP-dependent Clp protease ATP-binding subunit ClpB